MLSRIFWIGIAGIALIAGMALQDGGFAFGWGDHTQVSAKVERTIEDRVEQAIDRSFDKMAVVEADGHEIDLPAETKRAMAAAVGELVKAETDLAMVRVNDGGEQALQAAQARRDQARTEVDRLKAKIKGIEQGAPEANDALREQIREDVRAAVRESVRN